MDTEYTAVVYVPLPVTFYFKGPSFGWGVAFNGDRYLTFKKVDGVWQPTFNKLPAWLTSDDLDALREKLEEMLKNSSFPSYMC